ncbi:MAG: ribulose-phosphate 3-epimerase [Bacteroidota bacterium]
MAYIAPSILNSDFRYLGKTIEMLNRSDADWIHVDVMDGVFVPNISFGFPILKALKEDSEKPLDVHLMIQNPGNYIDTFKAFGADRLTVHYEACTHIHRVIQQINKAGMKAGVALNPGTPIYLLDDLLHSIDQVLLMSVNPGFGGQEFLPNTLKKTAQMSERIAEARRPILTVIDGGVDESNCQELVQAGAHVLVAGSFVFQSSDPLLSISALKKKSTHSLGYLS